MNPKATPETILQALDLKEFTQEEQEEMLLDINEMIYQNTMAELVEVMDIKTAKMFDELLDTDPSEEQIEAFLAEHVPTANRIMEDVIVELTNDILSATKE